MQKLIRLFASLKFVNIKYNNFRLFIVRGRSLTDQEDESIWKILAIQN